MILNRKENGNPEDFFDKSFKEYEQGFSARGGIINTIKSQVSLGWVLRDFTS